eukprot:TRINITY_DN10757_c0_g1_i1.p1 TRINITY_DN10757_c0_g1~~TRINITY_DN10757_c0_g1_i1.p1  ORF type:complete len:1127 (-),score=264.91 TRINITY_DN10757_c0_g1_i1:25-3384(-)
MEAQPSSVVPNAGAFGKTDDAGREWPMPLHAQYFERLQQTVRACRQERDAALRTITQFRDRHTSLALFEHSFVTVNLNVTTSGFVDVAFRFPDFSMRSHAVVTLDVSPDGKCTVGINASATPLHLGAVAETIRKDNPPTVRQLRDAFVCEQALTPGAAFMSFNTTTPTREDVAKAETTLVELLDRQPRLLADEYAWFLSELFTSAHVFRDALESAKAKRMEAGPAESLEVGVIAWTVGAIPCSHHAAFRTHRVYNALSATLNYVASLYATSAFQAYSPEELRLADYLTPSDVAVPAIALNANDNTVLPLVEFSAVPPSTAGYLFTGTRVSLGPSDLDLLNSIMHLSATHKFWHYSADELRWCDTAEEFVEMRRQETEQLRQLHQLAMGQSVDTESTLYDLPDDVIGHVLEFCSPQVRRCARLVSHTFAREVSLITRSLFLPKARPMFVVHGLASCYPNLTELSIRGDTFPRQMDDKDLLKIAQQWPALQLLDVSGRRCLSDAGLAQFTSICTRLQTLRLAGCTQLSGSLLFETIAERCLHFTELDVSNGMRVNHQSFEVLAATSALRSLAMSNCDDVLPLLKLCGATIQVLKHTAYALKRFPGPASKGLALPLADLPNLVELCVGQLDRDAQLCCSKLTKLCILRMGEWENIHEVAPTLGNIRILQLQNGRIEEPQLTAAIQHWRHLQVLCMSGKVLQSDHLLIALSEHCPLLTTLRLKGNIENSFGSHWSSYGGGAPSSFGTAGISAGFGGVPSSGFAPPASSFGGYSFGQSPASGFGTSSATSGFAALPSFGSSGGFGFPGSAKTPAAGRAFGGSGTPTAGRGRGRGRGFSPFAPSGFQAPPALTRSVVTMTTTTSQAVPSGADTPTSDCAPTTPSDATSAMVPQPSVSLTAFGATVASADVGFTASLPTPTSDTSDTATNIFARTDTPPGYAEQHAETADERRQRIIAEQIELGTVVSDRGLQRLVSGCPLLEVLYLGESPMTDVGVTHLSSLQHLRCLKLKDCKRVTAVGVQALARGCTKLHTLRLSHCTAVNDEAMKVLLVHCKTLHSLSIDGTNVTDNGLADVTSIPSLRQIHIGKCQATGMALQFLDADGPKLRLVEGKDMRVRLPFDIDDE